jgi:uncharacterized cofD-like protein
MKNKKVVILGGGTGSSRVLMSLKDLPLDITAVITVSDDGSSTGILRKEFTVPGIGDIRKVLSNLSTLPNEVKKVMEYRLSTYSDLNNHAIGNLALIAYLKDTGSLQTSIERLSKLLQVKHTVLPLSEDFVTLMGKTVDGEIIEGEENITKSGKRYEKIFYKEEPQVVPKVIEKIHEADLVIISIGSLYTSILPHLICQDTVKALNETKAQIMYICNAMTQPGETDGFGVSDHVATLEKYIGKDTIDVVVASNTVIEEEMLRKYETEEQKDQVRIDKENIQNKKYEVIEEDLLTTEEGKITHNSLKLSSVIFSYLMR